MDKEWFTEKEATQLLGVSRPVLWKLRKAGSLQASRIGKRTLRYHRSAIDAYMNDRAGAPMESPAPPVPQPRTGGAEKI